MIPNWLLKADEVVGVYRREPSPEVLVDWPDWLPSEAINQLSSRGITRPWSHQVEFAQFAFSGLNTAITTPTASGKSLAFMLPVIAGYHGVCPRATHANQSIRTKFRHTSLYLAPTKALAHDQLRAAQDLADPNWVVTAIDGDSDSAQRKFAQEYGEYLLTNPDMLHYSILPNHRKWARMLGSMRYIIIDEAHRYHGSFGAHTALVIRRLRRLCAHYGATPTMLFASATSPNASSFCGKLIAEPNVKVVNKNGAPTAGMDIVFWQPTLSSSTDAAYLLARLVDDHRQTITFVPSRRLAEIVAIQAQDQLHSKTTVASYRSGYLANDRRKIEAALQSGQLLGICSTNALELGIDISGMDAVIVHGFPGTTASLWQQFGRAGRTGRDALAVLIAREDPLDAYVLNHPELIFGPVEQQVVHPENPYFLGPQLAVAAQELPLRLEDERWFGSTMVALNEHLVNQKLLRHRATGWYWTRPDRAATYINLRAAAGKPIDVIVRDTGTVLGTVEAGTLADKTVHSGAVYLHQGEQYLVTDYDLADNFATVIAKSLSYWTQPLGTEDIAILSTTNSQSFGRGLLSTGEVQLTSQIIAYLRRDEKTGAVIDQTPLSLPARTFTTQALWWTFPKELIRDLQLSTTQTGAAVHAIEHCAIGLLPLFVPCDRWDIGGVSMTLHPDTAQATIFVHDGIAGGSGFAHLGYAHADEWLTATLDRLQNCNCEAGCPACVVSPKCGNANQFLDREKAKMLLAEFLN